MAASKGRAVLFNPEQSPTVFDKEGRTVGGAERVTVDEVDEVGQAAVNAGLLVREEEAKPKTESKSADAPPLPENADDSGASAPAKRR